MSEPVIKRFLLVFDHEKGKLLETRDSGSDSHGAVRAYAEMEKECEANPALEVVLTGSDSYETVEVTHANCFDGRASRSRSPCLAGV